MIYMCPPGPHRHCRPSPRSILPNSGTKLGGARIKVAAINVADMPTLSCRFSGSGASRTVPATFDHGGQVSCDTPPNDVGSRTIAGEDRLAISNDQVAWSTDEIFYRYTVKGATPHCPALPAIRTHSLCKRRRARRE
jgi:hypothetical protein